MSTRTFISRRSILMRLFWFAGSLVVLYAYWLVMANCVIENFWDPQFAYKFERVEKLTAEYPHRPLILVFGSSRVQSGFAPKVLMDGMKGDNAPLIYNFSLGGSDLFRQMISLRRLVEAGVKPQRVGIEVFGVWLGDPQSSFMDDSKLTIRLRRDELDAYSSYASEPERVRREWMKSRWNPAYRYGMRYANQTLSLRLLPFPNKLGGERIPYDAWGYKPTPASIPQAEYLKGIETSKIQFRSCLQDYKIQPKQDRALRECLKICRDAGIDVFLFMLPDAPEFRETFPPVLQPAVDAYLKQIKSEYGVQVIEDGTRIGSGGFLDGHHLNATGAEQYTRRFGEQLFQAPAKQ